MLARKRLYPRCATRCLPRFRRSAGARGGTARLRRSYHRRSADKSDSVSTEMLDRDDARSGVVTIEEIRGIASGRVGNGMRTLVHEERVYSVTAGAPGDALQFSTTHLFRCRYKNCLTRNPHRIPSRNDRRAAITSHATAVARRRETFQATPVRHHKVLAPLLPFVSGSAMSWKIVTGVTDHVAESCLSDHVLDETWRAHAHGRWWRLARFGGNAGATMRETGRGRPFPAHSRRQHRFAPGRSTRRISRSARLGSGTNINPNGNRRHRMPRREERALPPAWMQTSRLSLGQPMPTRGRMVNSEENHGQDRPRGPTRRAASTATCPVPVATSSTSRADRR